MCRSRLGEELAGAAGAAAVAAGVPWLAPLWRLDLTEPWSSGYRHFPVLALLTGVLGAATFAAVLAWRTRGFAAAWALLAGGYAWLLSRCVAPYVASWGPCGHPLRLGQLPYVLCTVLPRVAEDWAPLAAGLFLATWVARFRDGRTGFRGLLLPAALGAAAGAVVVRETRIWGFGADSLGPACYGPGAGAVALTLLASGAVPVAFAAWQMAVSWRSRDAGAAAAAAAA